MTDVTDTPTKDRQVGAEITPEMVEAGRVAFHKEWLNSDAYDSTEALLAIYRAMRGLERCDRRVQKS